MHLYIHIKPYFIFITNVFSSKFLLSFQSILALNGEINIFPSICNVHIISFLLFHKT